MAGRNLARGMIVLLLGLALLILVFAPTYSGWSSILLCAGMLGLLFNWESRPKSTLPIVRTSAPENTLEDQLRDVLDALISPVILVNHRGLIVTANRAAREAFSGLKTGFPLANGIRAPDILEAANTVMKGDASIRVDLVERVPVERSFEVHLRRLPIAVPGENNAIHHHVLIEMVETTEQRRVETMRVDFVANASHELRTPLASILGFVETLQGAAKDDTQARAHFLGIMETQARRMARLIDDLLSLSKIEQHAHIRPTTQVDLRSLLLQIINALSGLAQERAVTLRSSFTEGTDYAVIGDRDELLRLFENLIENAIKYGSSGQFVDITLTRDDKEGQVIVHIRDYGPGIAREHLPRLTERFYRVDSQNSRVQGGTGLGLAIVKHIVTRHRGRLNIHSEIGQGATFSVVLPEFK